MKISILLLICTVLQLGTAYPQAGDAWHAQWITAAENQNESNTWLAFRKVFAVDSVPAGAVARIAADSKYWLWINGRLVVFEGGLKRGPTPSDTYYDEVDIAPYLKQGENLVAVLLWYFGKDGFSHLSSGKAALVFECAHEQVGLYSDGTWQAVVHPAFETAPGTKPNYRLPESNIRFDARRDIGSWTQPGVTGLRGFQAAKTLGKPPVAPWNKLVKRPIPLWKDYGLKDYAAIEKISGDTHDTLVCKLPYNAQVTPWLQVNASVGQQIEVFTDHYMGGGTPNVRAEYITKAGSQAYESIGWMNGHHVYYVVPKQVEVVRLLYRETGFNTAFAGRFSCNDPFFNRLWEKAVRTLYVTMRDTYMDCPDRERAQWWGDVVIESGEAFYALDSPAASLTRKGILELINWQRPDGVIYSPVPAGNWDKELPGQMLASIGYYGFWNYYLNSGDKETIAEVFPGVRKYLEVWQLLPNGTLAERQGGWYWGDWGSQPDKHLLVNAWYYLALKGYRHMAELLGEQAVAAATQEKMAQFSEAFNRQFWDGKGYRTAAYEGTYDDRAQALAVVSGLADTSKYPALKHIFETVFLASPYMEKYVVEALFHMGHEQYAMQRLQARFAEMVNHPSITTLWEGWGIGEAGYGGGSTNHAWSGGGLTILAQYVAGISPIEPAFRRFRVAPRLGPLTHVNIGVPTRYGAIQAAVTQSAKTFSMQLTVPAGTSAEVHVPAVYRIVRANGKKAAGPVLHLPPGTHQLEGTAP